LSIDIFFQQILNGLTLGGVYALIALGYTMIYGIIKLINFAHGDIFMVGAFVGLSVIASFTSNFFIVIACAMLFCSVLGLLVERTAYLPLRQSSMANMIFTAVMVALVLAITYVSKNSLKELMMSKAIWIAALIYSAIVAALIWRKLKTHEGVGSSRINALISAIGMSIMISNVVAIVEGPQRKSFPQLIEIGNFNVGELFFSGIQIFIILSTFVLMFILYYIVNKTKAGTAMRAVSQNMNAARLMGINPNRVVGFTFALGSALAGAAGVLVSMNNTFAEPTLGATYGLKAFVAAVLGGIGSIPGAMLGGLILGVAEVFCVALLPSTYKDAIVYGILIAILIVRPTGIFGSTMKEKV
jgi:branched-chain amino acid transport system permease protein